MNIVEENMSKIEYLMHELGLKQETMNATLEKVFSACAERNTNTGNHTGLVLTGNGNGDN